MNAEAWQKVALGIVMHNDEGDAVNVDDGTVNELWADALRHASDDAWWAEGHQAPWLFDPPCPLAYGDDYERWLGALDRWADHFARTVEFQRLTLWEREVLRTASWYIVSENGRPEVAVWPPDVIDSLVKSEDGKVAR